MCFWNLCYTIYFFDIQITNRIKHEYCISPRKLQIPKRFKIKHFFPTIIDSNEPKDVGYDFLSPPPISEPKGFFTIPASEYEARVNLETLKYFQSLDTNDQLNIEATKLAYLTPIGVNLANLGNVDLSEEPFDAEKTR